MARSGRIAAKVTDDHLKFGSRKHDGQGLVVSATESRKAVEAWARALSVLVALLLVGCGSASTSVDPSTQAAADQYQKLSDSHEAAIARANQQLHTVKSFDEKIAAFFKIELDAEAAFDKGLKEIPLPDRFQEDGRVMLAAGQQLEAALPILIAEAEAGTLTSTSDDIRQWGVGIDTWKQADAKLRRDLGLPVPAYDTVTPTPS